MHLGPGSVLELLVESMKELGTLIFIGNIYLAYRNHGIVGGAAGNDGLADIVSRAHISEGCMDVLEGKSLADIHWFDMTIFE